MKLFFLYYKMIMVKKMRIEFFLNDMIEKINLASIELDFINLESISNNADID